MNKFKFAFNPFDKIAGFKAFLIGLLFLIPTVVIGHYNHTYFPGVIDIKYAIDSSLQTAFLVRAIGLFFIVTVFYLVGLLFARNIRFPDILGTVTLAYYPYLLPALMGFLQKEEHINNIYAFMETGHYSLSNNIGFILYLLICILTTIWTITLLYQAFKVSTGLKGIKKNIIFISALISSEVLAIIFTSCIIRFIYSYF